MNLNTKITLQNVAAKARNAEYNPKVRALPTSLLCAQLPRLSLSCAEVRCSHHQDQGPKDDGPDLRLWQDGAWRPGIELRLFSTRTLTLQSAQVITGAKSEDDARVAGRKVPAAAAALLAL